MASILRSAILTLACAAMLPSQGVLGQTQSPPPAGQKRRILGSLVVFSAIDAKPIACLGVEGSMMILGPGDEPSQRCPMLFTSEPVTGRIRSSRGYCGPENNNVVVCMPEWAGQSGTIFSVPDPVEHTLISVKGIYNFDKGISTSYQRNPLLLAPPSTNGRRKYPGGFLRVSWEPDAKYLTEEETRIRSHLNGSPGTTGEKVEGTGWSSENTSGTLNGAEQMIESKPRSREMEVEVQRNRPADNYCKLGSLLSNCPRPQQSEENSSSTPHKKNTPTQSSNGCDPLDIGCLYKRPQAKRYAKPLRV